MITGIEISNFKRFEKADIELGERVIFVGPNNAGKTTCLQALALWHLGLEEWNAKKGDKNLKQRTAVTLNRKDLINIPVSKAILLWKNLQVRKPGNENIKIQIWVKGITKGKFWEQGLEFDYANPESFYCRPIKNTEISQGKLTIPTELIDEVIATKIAFLQPMSGLSPIEPKLEPGRINVLLGEGRTAQIVRNLCYQVYSSPDTAAWTKLKERMKVLFGAALSDPEYNVARGEISLSYTDHNIELDLTAAGRGFQQMLLLLAYLYANPKSILLLDEPDAHLEILRQREMYSVLSEISTEQKSQIIIATHSEVLLNDAAESDIVMAFLGKPHSINKHGKRQLQKALSTISYDQYYLAEQQGWVLYLEGSTDLAILQALAKKLNHPATKYLERPFACHFGNVVSKVEEHYYGLREAKEDLVAIAIFDRLEKKLNSTEHFVQLCWKKREIENYFITKDVLLQYITKDFDEADMYQSAEAQTRRDVLNAEILALEDANKIRRVPSPWSDDTKITTDFLDILFDNYYEKLDSPNMMRKTNYHVLVGYLPAEQIDPEIAQVLDKIVEVAEKAKPQFA
ncbi:MAG: AAA family ATPase [Chitinophagia bacterium]|nr:AAA family ATPase [Chitinophagia bacterium]